MKPKNRISFTVKLLLLSSALVLAPMADAVAGGRGGRIYNPKRLRPKAEPPARGRTMRDPRKAPSAPRQPARATAIIPNPEPRNRGGSGYVKRGKYYYEKPGQIRATSGRRNVERIKIPHPNAKMR